MVESTKSAGRSNGSQAAGRRPDPQQSDPIARIPKGDRTPGRRRVLTVVDQYTREALATEARGSFSAYDVIDVLNRLSRSHRKPAVIHVDNGTEFASRALDAWAYREDVRLDFSRPGKPTDNAHIESFDARLHAECLNAHVFESLEDAEETLTSWRSDYNEARPHSALGMLTPREFADLG
jgi:putative transposase